MHDIYIFLFFCSKIIFDQKLFSYCFDKFDYRGSIVYLSCLALFCHVLINQGHWLQETLLCKNTALPLVVLEFHETSWKVLEKQICVDFSWKKACLAKSVLFFPQSFMEWNFEIFHLSNRFMSHQKINIWLSLGVSMIRLY